MKTTISWTVALLLAAGVGLTAFLGPTAVGDLVGLRSAEGTCAEHDLPLLRDPFCRPEVVEALGECPGHGIPEAFCFPCHPDLETAFRAEGDWCGEHGVPESQCSVCSDGPAPPADGSASPADEGTTCEAHDLPADRCPFCDPSLVVELGPCAGHGVPEALCTICHPALVPAFRDRGDWCAGHELPESACPECGGGPPGGPCSEHGVERCPFCHPVLVATDGDCAEHGVPEALCTTCRPGLEAAYRAVGDWCAGHEVPESRCEACGAEPPARSAREPSGPETAETAEVVDPASVPRHRRPPTEGCANDETVVRLADTGVVETVDIRTEPVVSRAVAEQRTCPADLRHDGNRLARITPRVQGVVEQVEVDLGERVEAGDVLCLVDSRELGEAKAALLRARAMARLRERNHERVQGLLDRGVATAREVLEAETLLEESRIDLAGARQRLRNLGLDREAVDEILRTDDTSSLLPVTAPFPGEVVERDAVVGETAPPDRALFTVADTSRMWAMLALREEDIPVVRPGQEVIFRPDGLRGETFRGRIDWVSPRIDPATRTLTARAVLPNRDGLLRARMYGTAEVRIRGRSPRLLVPREAVQWEGCCNVVFVRRSPTEFVPYKVEVGLDDGQLWEVLDGVSEGQEVVTRGSFLLKTELMRGAIGAGCCEVDPGSEG